MLSSIAIVEEQSALKLKLGIQVRVASIDNSKFLLYTDAATPEQITDPFQEIDVYDDFFSISRTLRLRFSAAMDAGDYTLVVTGLEGPSGATQPDEEVSFTLEEAHGFEEPETPVVEIEDKSLIVGTEVDTLVFGAGEVTPEEGTFYVVSIDPLDDEYYLEPDYNDGRVKVVFSLTPNIEELTSEFIKVQRKAGGLAPSRWESVDVTFSLDGTRPWVYIQFPEVEDGVYFQVGFKYRIRIKSTLGSD